MPTCGLVMRRKWDELMNVEVLCERQCAEHMRRIIILSTHQQEKDEGVPFQMDSI